MNNFQHSNKVVMVATVNLKENQTTTAMYKVPSNYNEIKSNIRELGLLNPLLVTKSLNIISGNLRFKIALELKLKTVPVVFLDVDKDKMDLNFNDSNIINRK